MVKENVFQKRLKYNIPNGIKFTVMVGQKRTNHRLKLTNSFSLNPFVILDKQVTVYVVNVLYGAMSH